MIFTLIHLHEPFQDKDVAPQGRDRFTDQEARPDNFGLWLPHPIGRDGTDSGLESLIPWHLVKKATRKIQQQAKGKIVDTSPANVVTNEFPTTMGGAQRTAARVDAPAVPTKS